MENIGGQRPGARLLKSGITTLVIGALWVLGTLERTEVDVVTTLGGFDTVETWLGPPPLAWVVLIVGLALTIAGYAKRHLAAVEANGAEPRTAGPRS